MSYLIIFGFGNSNRQYLRISLGPSLFIIFCHKAWWLTLIRERDEWRSYVSLIRDKEGRSMTGSCLLQRSEEEEVKESKNLHFTKFSVHNFSALPHRLYLCSFRQRLAVAKSSDAPSPSFPEFLSPPLPPTARFRSWDWRRDSSLRSAANAQQPRP